MLWTVLQTEPNNADAVFPLGLACVGMVLIGAFLIWIFREGNRRGGPH